MKQDICGYYFNEVNDTHSFYKGKEYIGDALIIQQKLLKKYPKHSGVIKEMFMHNQTFLLDNYNNYLFLPKNNYKLIFEGVIDIENFNSIKLSGITDNDIKTLYINNYINEDSRNNFTISIAESISLSPDGEKFIKIEARKPMNL
jgi:hypothetical protein